MVNNVLTTAQASDANLVCSIWQYLVTKVKVPYDAAATTAGLNAGYALNKNGTYAIDAMGLGVLDAEIDQDDLYKRVPVVAYTLDSHTAKSPESTGCGDGANYEYRTVKLTCVPTITLTADGIQSPSRFAYLTLKTVVWNAIGRSFIMPIVDSTQAKVNGLYPNIGYAEIHNATPPHRAPFKDWLVIDRRDFDVSFVLRIGVATADGL